MIILHSLEYDLEFLLAVEVKNRVTTPQLYNYFRFCEFMNEREEMNAGEQLQSK